MFDTKFKLTLLENAVKRLETWQLGEINRQSNAAVNLKQLAEIAAQETCQYKYSVETRLNNLEQRANQMAQFENQFRQRMNLCEQYIPSSYEVTELEYAKCWIVVKEHPILGTFHSQQFPSKGCAQKSLDDHFKLLQFSLVNTNERFD